MGIATLASSLPVATTPDPTMAGATAAANRATAQIARTRMRWLVPKGGVQLGRPLLPSSVESPGVSLTLAFEVAFRAQISHRRVERLAQAAEQVGELSLVDDQRRADRDP